MAPRTPKRLHASEPFVTLSIPKSTTSKTSEKLVNGTATSMKSPSKPSKNNKSASSKRVSRSSDALAKSNDASGHTESFSQLSSPVFLSIDTSFVSTDYDTPSTSQSTNRDTETKTALQSGSNTRARSKKATKPFADLSEGQDLNGGKPRNTKNASSSANGALDTESVRRSSTASLTDTGTRSSARARKLTTKAQALAGTNFLPSLQHTPDPESVIVVADDDQAKLQSSGSKQDQQKLSPVHDIAHEKVDGTTADDLETRALRTSARERKLTTRAIDLETTKPTRKRPGSPLTTMRSSKAPKKETAKSESLPEPSQPAADTWPSESSEDGEERLAGRQNSLLSPNSKAQKDEKNRIWLETYFPPRSPKPPSPPTKGPTEAEYKMFRDFFAMSAPIPAKPKKAPKPKKPSLPSGGKISKSQPKVKDRKQKVTLTNGAKEQQQATAAPLPNRPETNDRLSWIDRMMREVMEETRKAKSMCNLSCLSPGSRLYAFAKVASDWPDSDEDDNEDENIDLDTLLASSSTDGGADLMKKIRDSHCRCATKKSLSAAELPAKEAPTPVMNAESQSGQDALKNLPIQAANLDSSTANRRSTRDKPHKTYYEPAEPSIKRHTVRPESTGIASEVKRPGQSVNSSQITQSTESSLAGRSSKVSPSVNSGKGSAKGSATTARFNSHPLRFQFTANDAHTEAPTSTTEMTHSETLKSAPGKGSSHPQKSNQSAAAATLSNAADALRVSATKFNDIQSRSASPASNLSVSSQHALPMASKTKTRTGARTSAGGSVRLSMGETSEDQKEVGMKPPTILAPPQAKSIKLRFTTTPR